MDLYQLKIVRDMRESGVSQNKIANEINTTRGEVCAAIKRLKRMGFCDSEPADDLSFSECFESQFIDHAQELTHNEDMPLPAVAEQ